MMDNELIDRLCARDHKGSLINPDGSEAIKEIVALTAERDRLREALLAVKRRGLPDRYKSDADLVNQVDDAINMIDQAISDRAEGDIQP